MKLQRRCLYMGVAVILCCLTLRLTVEGAESPPLLQFLTYLQTGRPISVTESTEDTEVPQRPSLSPEIDVQKPLWMDFRDCVNIDWENRTSYPMHMEKWAQQDLAWDLRQEAPTVLIIHTHGSESYANFGQYKETDPYHTKDRNHNMVAVGERLAQCLKNAGISVIQDKTLHDYPAYAKAYNRSRASAQAYLDKYPTIKLVLDLHRDAQTTESGEMINLTATHNGKTAAKLAIVVGTDGAGDRHDNWESNMSTAIKLQTALEDTFPKICRPLVLRSSRYNQDLTPHTLLIEMGTAGGTLEEALLTAEILAEAIIKMADGVLIVK